MVTWYHQETLAELDRELNWRWAGRWVGSRAPYLPEPNWVAETNPYLPAENWVIERNKKLMEQEAIRRMMQLLDKHGRKVEAGPLGRAGFTGPAEVKRALLKWAMKEQTRERARHV